MGGNSINSSDSNRLLSWEPDSDISFKLLPEKKTNLILKHVKKMTKYNNIINDINVKDTILLKMKSVSKVRGKNENPITTKTTKTT